MRALESSPGCSQKRERKGKVELAVLDTDALAEQRLEIVLLEAPKHRERAALELVSEVVGRAQMVVDALLDAEAAGVAQH